MKSQDSERKCGKLQKNNEKYWNLFLNFLYTFYDLIKFKI